MPTLYGSRLEALNALQQLGRDTAKASELRIHQRRFQIILRGKWQLEFSVSYTSAEWRDGAKLANSARGDEMQDVYRDCRLMILGGGGTRGRKLPEPDSDARTGQSRTVRKVARGKHPSWTTFAFLAAQHT